MGVPRIATWGTPAKRASGRTALPPLTSPRGNVRVNQGADLPNSLTQRERMFELTQQPREFHCPQRAELLPNGPPYRDRVYRHPRMLEGPLQCIRLEYVWRDLLVPYR